ncbi:hypothetical protein [Sphingobium sp. BS19]|uniref:hypothetical protein n=1 Tax=Sphingobium sp. BS19 TaxID=3018973 RepID=UPI002490FF45|nr:hypothetical protein [Sphingobium sp. BS19]
MDGRFAMPGRFILQAVPSRFPHCPQIVQLFSDACKVRSDAQLSVRSGRRPFTSAAVARRESGDELNHLIEEAIKQLTRLGAQLHDDPPAIGRVPLQIDQSAPGHAVDDALRVPLRRTRRRRQRRQRARPATSVHVEVEQHLKRWYAEKIAAELIGSQSLNMLGEPDHEAPIDRRRDRRALHHFPDSSFILPR